MDVDHINGNKLDNRRSNLRVCTHKQNMWNMSAHKATSSRFKGVTAVAATGNWCAVVGNTRTSYIAMGTYRSEEDAARAADRGAIKLYGEFARLNFPDEYQQRLKELNGETPILYRIGKITRARRYHALLDDKTLCGHTIIAPKYSATADIDCSHCTTILELHPTLYKYTEL